MCAGTIESDVTCAECTSSVNIREQFFSASTLYLRPKRTINMLVTDTSQRRWHGYWTIAVFHMQREQDSSEQASDLLEIDRHERATWSDVTPVPAFFREVFCSFDVVAEDEHSCPRSRCSHVQVEVWQSKHSPRNLGVSLHRGLDVRD
jgi:hypothetical protein